VDIAANNLASLLLDFRTDPASYAEALELAKGLESSDNPAVLDTVGWAYYRNKDYPKAVQFLERAVAAAGQVPLLRYHLGMAYLASNNTDGARQELKQAVGSAKVDFPGIEVARETLKKLTGGAT
jgi:predicted Zn-dependent protease